MRWLVINTDNESYKYIRNAQTMMKLRIGGKSGIDQNHLLAFNATIIDKINGRSDLWKSVQIGSLGQVGNDGNLYITLPGNEEYDVTPIVPGADYYIFDLHYFEFPSPSIYANDTSININDNSTPPAFCVGENITLSNNWGYFGLPIDVQLSYQWMPSAKFVNHSSQLYQISSSEPPITNYYGSTNYDFLPGLLNNPLVGLWYLTSGIKHIKETVDYTFSNGQTAEMSYKGRFQVHCPIISMLPFNQDQTNRYYSLWASNKFACTLSLGAPITGLGDMNYSVGILSYFWGRANLTQLITCGYSNPVFAFSDERCDGSEFYGDDVLVYGIGTNYLSGLPTPSQLAKVNFDDAPRGSWIVGDNVVSLSARDFIRFKPNGENSIWVTLGIVTLNTVGVAEVTSLTGYSITSQNTPPPFGPDNSFELPVWSKSVNSR